MVYRENAVEDRDVCRSPRMWKSDGSSFSFRPRPDGYRSFDLDEFEPYQGRLGELGVPALILWGEQDDYLPRGYA